jgi:hypothetical protein
MGLKIPRTMDAESEPTHESKEKGGRGTKAMAKNMREDEERWLNGSAPDCDAAALGSPTQTVLVQNVPPQNDFYYKTSNLPNVQPQTSFHKTFHLQKVPPRKPPKTTLPQNVPTTKLLLSLSIYRTFFSLRCHLYSDIPLYLPFMKINIKFKFI